MKLTLFNGSPRGKTGNTELILEQFAKGYLRIESNRVEVAYLNHLKETEQQVAMFKNAEHVILAFPLYTDAMPGIVKAFIEALEPLCGGANMPDIGFIVHSGFPEAIHSRAVERYLEKLAARRGCRYIGTVIKGGSEGMQEGTERANSRILTQFLRLGEAYSTTGTFDREIVRKLAQPERFPALLMPFIKIAARLNLFNGYWDRQLKANNAYAQRFDKPFMM